MANDRVSRVVEDVSAALQALSGLMPIIGVGRSILDGQLRIQVSTVASLDEIPGVAVVIDKGEGYRFRYDVVKELDGVAFICVCDAEELKSLLKPKSEVAAQ